MRGSERSPRRRPSLGPHSCLRRFPACDELSVVFALRLKSLGGQPTGKQIRTRLPLAESTGDDVGRAGIKGSSSATPACCIVDVMDMANESLRSVMGFKGRTTVLALEGLTICRRRGTRLRRLCRDLRGFCGILWVQRHRSRPDFETLHSWFVLRRMSFDVRRLRHLLLDIPANRLQTNRMLTEMRPAPWLATRYDANL